MQIISSTALQRNMSRYQTLAESEPVMVTHNGQERLVLLSVQEYRRLAHLDRVVLLASELSDDELSALAQARVPAEYEYLDDKS